MANTPIWTDEVRFIFVGEPPNARQNPVGQGTEQELHCYHLLRTNDHNGCPHQVLGWAFKNFGTKTTVQEAITEMANDFPLVGWERKEPPENEYGKEVMYHLKKADEIMKETLENWHRMGVGVGADQSEEANGPEILPPKEGEGS